ncbi:MAG TPA: class I SAM-dependent methyltransferase [Dehalococcoidia bacterium]|nr:class I SAM-dependent methyltransferase [Dehalococcoidia bacterium]
MTGSDTAWSGDDSRVYSRLADIAVPSRREQMATLITQIRFKTTDAFKLVDLACGESGLTKAIQTLYPKARATALDGSQSMLTVAPLNLAEFEDRTETGVFDIATEDWLHQIDGVGLVVLSLVIHHLDSTGKPRLYRNVFNCIAERGALLVVDIVAGRRP